MRCLPPQTLAAQVMVVPGVSCPAMGVQLLARPQHRGTQHPVPFSSQPTAPHQTPGLGAMVTSPALHAGTHQLSGYQYVRG